MVEDKRTDFYQRQADQMRTERTSFISHWQEIQMFIAPRRGRFFIGDRNKGDKRWNNIINSAGTKALRTAAAGFFAGVMNPTEPWFKLQTPDPGLMSRWAVQVWLEQVEVIIRTVFEESNFYQQSQIGIKEDLLFGTALLTHVDDFQDVARWYAHTAGSYMIGMDSRGVVNTAVREFEWTVGQIVDEFGIENVSTAVKTQYDLGNYQSWFPITHFIGPNRDYAPGKAPAKNKRFKSCYYEPGNRDAFLRESGFDLFPGYALRWETTGEDIYGTDCPGMMSLGDVKGLQIEERRKAQAIDKQVNPPLSGPSSLRNVPVSSLPGGLTIYDSDGKEQNGLRPIYVNQTNLGELRLDISAIERRLDENFYVPLFLAITNMEGVQPKNQLELTQRNQERLLQLGPALTRFHGEYLSPNIDRVFEQCLRANILPPAPPELQGRPLKVKYISELAKAQRSMATGGIDRLVAYIGGLVSAGFTEVGDKFNADQSVDEYAKITGVSPKLIVPDDQVAQIRQQRNEQKQAAMQAEQAQQAGATLNHVGNTVKQLSDPGARALLTGAPV